MTKCNFALQELSLLISVVTLNIAIITNSELILIKFVSEFMVGKVPCFEMFYIRVAIPFNNEIH